MGIKLSLLALVIALFSGCTTINDKVVNPINDHVVSPIIVNPTKNYIINPIKSIFYGPTVKQAEDNYKTSKPAEGAVMGVYEHRRGGVIYRRVLLKGGILEYYLDGVKVGESRWSEAKGEILCTPDGGKVTDFMKFEPNGDLSWIATTRNGVREEIEKLTFKRIR